MKTNVPNDYITTYHSKRYCALGNVQTNNCRVNKNTVNRVQLFKFNTMPVCIKTKSNCSVQLFKRQLDKVLTAIPDEPQIPRYNQLIVIPADSNSLLDILILNRASSPLVMEWALMVAYPTWAVYAGQTL